MRMAGGLRSVTIYYLASSDEINWVVIDAFKKSLIWLCWNSISSIVSEAPESGNEEACRLSF